MVNVSFFKVNAGRVYLIYADELRLLLRAARARQRDALHLCKCVFHALLLSSARSRTGLPVREHLPQFASSSAEYAPQLSTRTMRS